uniref:Clock circadian regulator b n=1 Tax=Astyanax mexicanus TaxID=7994 RepID=A0A8B9JRF9_ASTMX
HYSTAEDDGSIFDGLMEEDDRDKAKRVSRNKSEKRRRDQFNVLIKELGTMLPGNTRKMDKSTILQKSIDYLRKHKGDTHTLCKINISRTPPTFLPNQQVQMVLTAFQYNTTVILSDLVDQNLLNFLPIGEHAEVYKALSSHPDCENISPDFLKTKNQLEFCCHMLRGSMDPKEPPVYEYVKFIGNFKALTNVPRTTRNGLEGVLQRSLRPAFDDQVCFVATVRLAKPQFIKEMCTVEDPNEEFTSRHSLEWKFLLLDHRAPPIIGYLPFEVLGTSGYDYYHVDDLESLAKCHEQLMQFGKGKSCYYRFLTKGQQWIWLQTHYYITYHQWNSRPEFIVCTHTVVSYAEVRAEQRREMGIEESPPELTADKSQDSGSESQLNTSSLKEALERFDRSRSPSTSSRSSRKSSHTAVSDSTFCINLQNAHVAVCSSHREVILPVCVCVCVCVRGCVCVCVKQYSAQVNAMQHLKEQLEQRTQMIEANIKKQQEELRQIHEQLQRVQGSGIQMFLQQSGSGINVQVPQVGGASVLGATSQAGVVAIQGQSVTSSAHSGTQHILPQQQAPAASQQQNQQGSVLTQRTPVYNTMMISQPGNANVVQIPSTLAQSVNQGASINRFPAGQQLVTKLVTAPMACGTVMVPTTMFMGQVVTAYSPFAQQQGQTQTIALQPQVAAQSDSQTQAPAVQSAQQQGATQPQQQQQFLQGTRILHGNQSTQLILQAFPIQQQGAFTTTQQLQPQQQRQRPQQPPQQQHQQRSQQQQLKPQTQKTQKPPSSHRTESSSAQSQ